MRQMTAEYKAALKAYGAACARHDTKAMAMWRKRLYELCRDTPTQKDVEKARRKHER